MFYENPFVRNVVELARPWMALMSRACCRTSDSCRRSLLKWQLQAALSFLLDTSFYLNGGFFSSFLQGKTDRCGHGIRKVQSVNKDSKLNSLQLCWYNV